MQLSFLGDCEALGLEIIKCGSSNKWNLWVKVKESTGQLALKIPIFLLAGECLIDFSSIIESLSSNILGFVTWKG